jgi:nucleoside-triphosphatase THEP1
MFALTTLERVISKRWVGMPGAEKTEIRNKLNEYLVKRHRSVPGFITKKIIKLVSAS